MAWILVPLMVALAPMAWASPPDPTWLTGLYDSADFDEVVTYLTSGLVALPTLPPVIVATSLTYISTVCAPAEGAEVSHFRSPRIPSAPPPPNAVVASPPYLTPVR